MRRLFVGVLFLTLVRMGSSQVQTGSSSMGKEFFCMVMKYYGTPIQGTDIQYNNYIRLFLSSPVRARVTISVENPAFLETHILTPNVVETVTLPAEVENIYPETPTRCAIHIVADTDISAYVIYHKQYSTDSYMALPVTALGNQYIAACFQSSTT